MYQRVTLGWYPVQCSEDSDNIAKAGKAKKNNCSSMHLPWHRYTSEPRDFHCNIVIMGKLFVAV